MSNLRKPWSQSAEAASSEAPAYTRRKETIRARVLRLLGRPKGLLLVSVLPLWGNKFRVNVWTGDGACATIPNSYFVTADAEGTILTSEPPIAKQY
jgi:hypothetical protein